MLSFNHDGSSLKEYKHIDTGSLNQLLLIQLVCDLLHHLCFSGFSYGSDEAQYSRICMSAQIFSDSQFALSTALGQTTLIFPHKTPGIV